METEVMTEATATFLYTPATWAVFGALMATVALYFIYKHL